jgi:hypothetical protein
MIRTQNGEFSLSRDPSMHGLDEIDLLRESLARDDVWVQAVGNSMFPCFSKGDLLLVRKAGRFFFSDILLYSHRSHLTAHRLIRRKRNAEGNLLYQTKPDNGFCLDAPVPSEAILGKVIAIQKGGKLERTDTISGWLGSLTCGAVSAMKIRREMGRYRVKFSIGGLSIQVSANRSEPVEWLRQAFASYRSDSEPDLTIAVHCGWADPYRNLNRLYADPYFIYADPDFENRFCVWAGRRHFGIGDVLRLIISFALVQRGGCLLHSCGAVLGGHAYCLAGPSGAGKSTIAGLLDHQGTLLSDETTAISRFDNVFHAWATPFFGDFGRITSNTRAPLQSLVFLQQAGHFRSRRLDPHDAARRLMQNVFLIGQTTKPHITALLDIVSEITQKVPAFELEFRPEEQIWRHIREKMSPGAS